MKIKVTNSLIFLGMMLPLLFLFSCSKDENKSNLFLYSYFKADKTNIIPGDTIHFQDYSIGYPQKWEWTFEGAEPGSSTEQNPSVIYNKPGQYKVALSVSAGDEKSSRTKEKYITVVSAGHLDKNLIAYFPFNGSAEDVGPNHVVVTNHGNVTFNGTDRNGNENSAAVFDGSSAVIVPDNPAFNFGTSDFTISCWIKTDYTDKMMIWQESGAGGSRDNQTWLRIGDNNSDRMLRFDTEDGGGGNIINYGNGPETGVSDGNWHQVVCVREGGITRLYIDGVKKDEMIKASPKNVSNEGDFKIGTQEGPLGSYHTYFTGMLDDLSIYNKALTDEEVAALYLL